MTKSVHANCMALLFFLYSGMEHVEYGLILDVAV